MARGQASRATTGTPKSTSESARATFQTPRQRLEHMPGQLIVRVHEGAVRPSVGAGRLSMHARRQR